MKIVIYIHYYFIITNIHTFFFYILFIVGLFGIYLRIFIIGIVFNIIKIYLNIVIFIIINIIIFSIINVFIFNIFNNMLTSYCMYLIHLISILIDRARRSMTQRRSYFARDRY